MTRSGPGSLVFIATASEKLPQLLAALHHHADVASQGGDASFAVFEKPTSSRGHNGKSKSPAEVKDVFMYVRLCLWAGVLPVLFPL